MVTFDVTTTFLTLLLDYVEMYLVCFDPVGTTGSLDSKRATKTVM